MQAIVIHQAHDLRVQDFPLPEAGPGPGEVAVRMAAGGICGSDLHYYHEGGIGQAIRVKEPMALGHEAAGFVASVGAGVTTLAVGDLVAVNPSSPCGACRYCSEGLRNHCEAMRFNGSAMRFPHEQGLFRAEIVVPAGRAVKLPPGVKPSVAALCEPFAVCLHAVAQADDLAGRTVLVSGCGPIGVLTIVAAKLAGAARIIATDIAPRSLEMAARMGATDCVDVSGGTAGLAAFAEGKGQVDAAFECSGAPRALAGLIPLLRPRASLVLVGLGGDAPVPVNAIVAKELKLMGSFRFDREFDEAARLIGGGKVDLAPVVSAVYPMRDAVQAFEHAGDRSRATKVAIALSERGLEA
jgi:L-idonate 5-dehydrogenase